ncbi:unnamed protein product, partial [Rotaria magnacalcarata]
IIFILNDSKLFLIYRNEIVVLSKENEEIFNENSNPFGLLVPCQFLSFNYYQCESIEEIAENDTRSC